MRNIEQLKLALLISFVLLIFRGFFFDLKYRSNILFNKNLNKIFGVVHVTHIEKVNNTYCAITHKNAE